MLRLNDIAEQRMLYSSVDDIVYKHESDSDYDEPPENSNYSQVVHGSLYRCVVQGLSWSGLCLL